MQYSQHPAMLLFPISQMPRLIFYKHWILIQIYVSLQILAFSNHAIFLGSHLPLLVPW